MSYLNLPRLVFTGDFQADVNTVNNDVRHYYNPAFTEDNWMQEESGHGGWWNPDGGSIFRLVNCSVKQACYPDGSQANDSEKDPIIGKNVSGPLNASSAKIVDLDPQFQFTSQLWGLKLCIYDNENEVLLSGTVEPSGFKDLQFRQFKDVINGQALGASWTSIISDVQWGENANKSKILSELKRQWEKTKLLSCQLVSFGYYKEIGSERFSLGRLLGSIGPYLEGEPKQYPQARRIIGIGGQFQYSNSLYDEDSSMLTIDIGGSIPLSTPLGETDMEGELCIGVAKVDRLREVLSGSDKKDKISVNKIVKIGEIPYYKTDWILQTAGISDFKVSHEAREYIDSKQLVLFTNVKEDPESYQVLACETKDGLSIRADDNVRRIDAKSSGSVDFQFKVRTYQWGKKLAGGKISFKPCEPNHMPLVDSNTCITPEVPKGIDPDSGQVIEPCTCWPKETILLNGELSPEIISDDNGEATVTVSVFDPKNPRGYIDGQIFLIGYTLENLPKEQQYTFFGNCLMDGLIMHVRNAFEEIKEPEWSDISEIMTQYRNLYPLMTKNILDLGNPKEIVQRQKIMLYAFTRDIHDPTYMPVSRDLSEGKRKTIVNWLKTGMKGADDLHSMPTAYNKASIPHLIEGVSPTSQPLNTRTKDNLFSSE